MRWTFNIENAAAGPLAYWRDARRIVMCKRECDKSPFVFVMTLRVGRRH